MDSEKAEVHALEVVRAGGPEVDALIDDMERQLQDAGGMETGFFHLNFKNPKMFTKLLVCFASMGGLLCGIDQSLISGANLYLPKDLDLNASQNSLVNGGMPLGAVGGALILSPTNEMFGRKWAIIISIILYTVGAALEAGSMNFGMIISSRVILGLGVGLEGGTVPVYVAETVERRIRGNLVSLFQFNLALGEVLGYAVGAMFNKVPGNWRYILGSSLLFSTIMGVGILFFPESPRYLLHKGKVLESYKVWKRIRGIESHEAREEYFVMMASVREEQTAIKESATNRNFPWLDFFFVPRARRALIYANIMILLGQLTGINSIMYYMSVLMTQIGFDPERANYMSIVGGGALFLGTIPAILWMETYGRRFWAMVAVPGFFCGLVLIGISYQFDLEQHPVLVEGLYLTGLIVYMGFFGCYACLSWVIPSEVYPTYLRSYGMTTSDALLFLMAFLMTYNFTDMQNAMGKTGLALGFYGGIAVVGEIYQLFFMPETKDKTLEEIDEVFNRPTMDIVRENWAGIKENTANILKGRFDVVIAKQKKRRSTLQDVRSDKMETES